MFMKYSSQLFVKKYISVKKGQELFLKAIIISLIEEIFILQENSIR